MKDTTARRKISGEKIVAWVFGICLCTLMLACTVRLTFYILS